jgi:tRNA 2-selenouridine synthase
MPTVLHIILKLLKFLFKFRVSLNEYSLPLKNYLDFKMKQIITIDFYYHNLNHIPIIDVRSPGEFAKGHIPNAHNIDLFTNEERAIVGTAYKKESKERAIELGYEFVIPKLNDFITQSVGVAPEKEVVVHCWRGGMRSNAFADHLIENGFNKVYVIEKGYKAFRNYVLHYFEQPFNLKILGGYTGTGKTEILHFLENKGRQVIDLEGLANHRGSAFGGIDLQPQPTTEQFENKLFSKLRSLNPILPIWIEDESRIIGTVIIPNLFYIKMKEMPVYFLNVPIEKRIEHLVDTYASLSQDKLADAIGRIGKKLGYDKAKFALESLEDKNYHKVVEIILFYYDKYYLKGLQKRQESSIQELEITSANHVEIADILIRLIDENNG